MIEVRLGKPLALQLWFFSVKRMPLEGIEYETQSDLHGFPAKSLKWVLPGLVNDWVFHRSLCSAAFSMFTASWSKDGCQSMTSQHPKIASRAAWKEREEGNPLTPSFLLLRRKVFPETVHRFSLCLIGEN